METALTVKIKHLHNRERVIIVLFKGNNQFLFIQMIKLRPWINFNFSLNKAETVLFRKRALSNILEGVTLKIFWGQVPRPPFAKRDPYEKIFIVRVARLLTGLPHICPQIQFSCLCACYFLPCQSLILYN